MNRQDLEERTMTFAVRVLKMTNSLPNTAAGRTVANQVARCGTSVASNYRAALRGKSRADFANKINIVLEEADETAFWLELSTRAELLSEHLLTQLKAEAIELTKIFNATLTTTRRSGKKS